MKRTLKAGATALTILAGLGMFAGGAIADTYDVTIYNLTHGQILSPPVVAAHSRGVSIFTPGVAATPGLAAEAEDAQHAVLVTELEDAGATVEIGAGGIMPGGHIVVSIETSRHNRRISVVGMLVTTNDAFYGLNGVRAGGRSNSYYVPAYDAGSEENNEDCDFIPGPPCGNPLVRATDKAEGFVHIHNGVHGGADLVPAMHDWRNPVAKIVVTRVGDSRSDDDDGDD